mmetsp:Transcript_26335/g.42659  ORF Transcript_26335/g.42659 Transcript_26335/m.42659 type:complete len:314 (-) Transcript_26335:31-972(-)
MDDVERSIVERIAAGKTVSDAEEIIPRLKDATKARLDSQQVPEAAKLMTTKYKCTFCKNNDQGWFEEDPKHGQVTCKGCGTVIEDRKIHDGEWKRQFSGEENPSQHGPAPDPRFSSGHNLRTNITSGSGRGAGQNVTKKELVDLKMIQNTVEMNLSNMKFGNDVRKTRIGYKDQQKKEVFLILDEIGNSLQLHDAVITNAQGYFADFRDAHEQIQQRDLVTAACLILSLRTLSASGEDVYHTDSGKSVAGVKRKAEDSADLVIAARQQRIVKPKVEKLSFEQLHPFNCPKCNKGYSNKKDLRLHSKRCTGKAN